MVATPVASISSDRDLATKAEVLPLKQKRKPRKCHLKLKLTSWTKVKALGRSMKVATPL